MCTRLLPKTSHLKTFIIYRLVMGEKKIYILHWLFQAGDRHFGGTVTWSDDVGNVLLGITLVSQYFLRNSLKVRAS